MRERGFTLIEMAVVLAIIAVLAAVLTPIVTGYLDQARIARATADVKTIADAIRLYYRDSSKYPVFANSSATTADATELIGPGNVPLFSTTATTQWSAYSTSTNLVGQLDQNLLLLQSGSLVSNPGKVAFRGPYIGALDTDPWGNEYIVTATNLATANGNWAIVISAGPNGTIETNPNQSNTAAFSVTGDDIIAIIK